MRTSRQFWNLIVGLGCAAVLSTGGAIAQSPPRPPAPLSDSVTFTGAEVEQMIGQMNDVDLMVRTPDGGFKPYLGRGAATVQNFMQSRLKEARKGVADKADADARAAADLKAVEDEIKRKAP